MCGIFAADNTSSTIIQLTDDDKGRLERWERMKPQRQQHGVSTVMSAAGDEISEDVMTSSVSTVTTVNSGALQLSSAHSRCLATTVNPGALQLTSADSRLADCHLADANLHLDWSPSVSLSSGDISKCLQASTASSQTIEAADAVATGNGFCMMDMLQQCCAGYGIGELVPSMINKYVISPYAVVDDGA